MNTYIMTQIGNDNQWTCKAESEEKAWESLPEIKRLPINKLKKLFKITTLNNSKK